MFARAIEGRSPMRVVEVERADMLDDGWSLWWQFVEAGMAWEGTEAPNHDGPVLLANRDLGFTRMVATRTSA